MSENNNENKEEMQEENDNIIVLTDEDGKDSEFEWLDTVEYNGENYVVVLPVEDDSDEVVILKIEEGEEEDNFIGVEDEDEMNAVFEIFKEKNKENFDFED